MVIYEFIIPFCLSAHGQRAMPNFVCQTPSTDNTAHWQRRSNRFLGWFGDFDPPQVPEASVEEHGKQVLWKKRHQDIYWIFYQ